MSTRIAPEKVARRIASAREDEKLTEVFIADPRIREALWFIQAASLKPRGLELLTNKLITRFPERLGTTSMRGWWKQKRLTKAQTLQLWNELPLHRARFGDDSDDRMIEALLRDAETLPEPTPRELPVADLKELFAKLLHEKLPQELRDFCCDEEASFHLSTKWFGDLWPSLVTLICEHTAETLTRVARTTVTNQVFDALDYASSERVMVRVDGDPRFGKTESVTAWCDAHPGQVRLVTVPCSNREYDLYTAIAEALGMETGPVRRSELKTRVEYVLDQARLMIVFDEAHFLIPQRYSETTPPMRINWVRTRIVDRGLPCALVITPQSFDPCLDGFLKKTKYRFDQFFGRSAATFTLPNTLEFEDLLSVAQLHFPGIDKDLLELIASKAMQSESYLQAMEHIAKRAQYLARRNGKKTVDEGSIEAAFRDILPSVQFVRTKPEPKRDRGSAVRSAEGTSSRAGAGLAQTVQPAGNRFAKDGRNKALEAQEPSVIAA